MPSAPLHPCAEPQCPALVSHGRCPEHQQQARQAQQGGQGHRFYKTAAWQRLRATVLREAPFCCDCQVVVSAEADHIVPHRGNRQLFFDRTNLAGRCKSCHSKKTQRGA